MGREKREREGGGRELYNKSLHQQHTSPPVGSEEFLTDLRSNTSVDC